jgi:hypothetical protein
MPKAKEITSDLEEVLLEHLRHGNTRRTAALASGISLTSFTRHLCNPDFASKVAAAEEGAVAVMVNQVATSGSKSWQAAAWWLERRRPNDWRPGAQVRPSKLSDEELLKQAAEIVHRFGIHTSFNSDLEPDFETDAEESEPSNELGDET